MSALIALTLSLTASIVSAQQSYQVVVYGGTAAGVISAISAAREGMSVALLEPGRHLGGMASGGLSATDFGDKHVIGGYALEFYKRVGAYYNVGQYGNVVAWYYEPHIGEKVFDDMTREAGVKVFLNQRLRQKNAVTKEFGRIAEIRMEKGPSFRALVYIDATYEGDLMAQAGVSYTVGRESVSQYGETLAGVRAETPYHQWLVKVSPYDSNGKLLAEVSPELPGIPGAADAKIESYNFRLCITQEPGNKVPFPKPVNYDPKRYELLARLLQASMEKNSRSLRMNELMRLVKLPNGKADANNNGAFSTDYIGGSWQYPEADYQRRIEIWENHVNYIKGFFYFLANDQRVPPELRLEVNSWGLAGDEFRDTGHWPFQLYIRECRRMVGEYVMTQEDIQEGAHHEDSIGMGSYNVDSHNVHRYVTPEGWVENEGDVQVPVLPYQISYRVLLPKSREVLNLLVPVCVSATHVAYSSLRMEPQYMIMGQAAGAAASIAVKENAAVQEIDVVALGTNLKRHGAVLKYDEPLADPQQSEASIAGAVLKAQ
jgi:hypothetical protein